MAFIGKKFGMISVSCFQKFKCMQTVWGYFPTSKYVEDETCSKLEKYFQQGIYLCLSNLALFKEACEGCLIPSVKWKSCGMVFSSYKV